MKCNKCGSTKNLEKHHKKHRIRGGSDANPNRVWLCQDCHAYQHAKEKVLKAIQIEGVRLNILEKRLKVIEAENTVKKILERGYRPYFELYPEVRPRMPSIYNV